MKHVFDVFRVCQLLPDTTSASGAACIHTPRACGSISRWCSSSQSQGRQSIQKTVKTLYHMGVYVGQVCVFKSTPGWILN